MVNSENFPYNSLFQCCDHPYLLDPSLQTFVNGGLKIGDYLSNGIEVSGKFFLLDKLLQEVKEKQLRVLIVFQVCYLYSHIFFVVLVPLNSFRLVAKIIYLL